MSARFVCRYACRCGNVDASGTATGTTGRLSAVDFEEGRAAGKVGRRVQCAARTSECVGYRGTMLDEVACWAAKEATVGVVGLEADGLDDEIANTCVGNAEDDGALDEGRIGTSSEDGRCAFGSELGVESRLTAAIIL